MLHVILLSVIKVIREIGSPNSIVLRGLCVHFFFYFLGRIMVPTKRWCLFYIRGAYASKAQDVVFGFALYKYPNIVVIQKLLKISHEIGRAHV